MENDVRPIYEIAAEIHHVWRKKDGKPNIWFGAVPYLDAMAHLDKVTDMHEDDTAKSVVIYFLSNAPYWRGEDAQRIKAELKSMFGLK